jgi:hypothetical protein
MGLGICSAEVLLADCHDVLIDHSLAVGENRFGRGEPRELGKWSSACDSGELPRAVRNSVPGFSGAWIQVSSDAVAVGDNKTYQLIFVHSQVIQRCTCINNMDMEHYTI